MAGASWDVAGYALDENPHVQPVVVDGSTVRWVPKPGAPPHVASYDDYLQVPEGSQFSLDNFSDAIDLDPDPGPIRTEVEANGHLYVAIADSDHITVAEDGDVLICAHPNDGYDARLDVPRILTDTIILRWRYPDTPVELRMGPTIPIPNSPHATNGHTLPNVEHEAIPTTHGLQL